MECVLIIVVSFPSDRSILIGTSNIKADYKRQNKSSLNVDEKKR